jgi:LysM repeat protein
VNGSRYRELFKLKSTDYKSWAHGLKRAGYATDPNYATLLIRKIEDYGLHALDLGGGRATKTVASEPAVTKPANDSVVNPLPEQAVAQAPIKVISLNTGMIETINNVQYVIVQDNDTYESLAEKYMLLSWEISRYNDLPAGTPLQPGQLLYLQPKRKMAEPGFTTHLVQQGDSMYSVSQKYAVKLSSLYKMNLMDEGTECSVGQRLRLR